MGDKKKKKIVTHTQGEWFVQKNADAYTHIVRVNGDGLGLPPLPSPEYALVGTEIKQYKDLKDGDMKWNGSLNEFYPHNSSILMLDSILEEKCVVLRPISKDELVKAINEALDRRRHSASIMTPITEYVADSIITLLNKEK